MFKKGVSQIVYKLLSMLIVTSLWLSTSGFGLVSSARTNEEHPNLSPFTPDGWSNPIVAAPVTETSITEMLFDNENAYVDWAVTNSGGVISASFTTCLYYDGQKLQCWDTDGLTSGESATQIDWVLTIPTTPGLHHLEIVTDVNNVILESNESDNSWGADFEWTAGLANDDASGPPLIDDAFTAPDLPLEAQGYGSSNTPGEYNTSDYMIGSVAVGIIFPESTGNGENWTPARRDQVISEIQTGLNWWVQQANLNGVDLSFQYEIQYPIATTYEPITLASYNQGLWIDQVMTAMGYGGSNYFLQTNDYVNALREQKGTQWAYAIFVVDSLNDLDGTFSDGYSAYAYNSGPFVVVTTENGGWGINNMDRVSAHESAHIFWAADTYYQAGYGGCMSTTELYGYLGIANSECGYNNPGADTNHIMYGNSWNLHWTTAQQIGWRDSDFDGRMDPVDTTPGINVSRYAPDPTTNNPLTFSGTAYDVPYPHNPECCVGKDLNTNIVSVVQYRLDGGAWLNASPSDGSFNTDYETFTFTTPILSQGAHTLDVKEQNSAGVTTSTWTDTVTVSTKTTAAPTLRSPTSGITTNDSTPAFWWLNVKGGQTYEIAFATDSGFTNTVHSNNNAVSPYSPPPLGGGTYYWRVRARNILSQPGAWSLSRKFTVDTTGPSAPVPSAPANSTTVNRTPTFKWSSSSTAVIYEFQYDNDSGFGSPNYTVTVRGISRRPPALPLGTYYWHVRAKDAAGNWSTWSSTFTITISK